MAKMKTVFICNECGYETSKWLGKCPSCNQWNSFVEEFQDTNSKSGNISILKEIQHFSLGDIKVEGEERYSTGMREMDRVLGGGYVRGSLILVGGDPGIGKSTLLLQISQKTNTPYDVVYISGEESVRQIKLRADRLSVTNSNIKMISEINFRLIEDFITKNKPGLVIIDSIQTMYNDELVSAPGSVSQVRDITTRLMRLAKNLSVTIIIVGHVTKEGAIAGPRVLEHMVDTVLYFEGERHLHYRILRAVKNRFGSTNEIGIFEMTDMGLLEVENPSTALLSERSRNTPGSVVVSNLEGSRPMLIELQALVCPSGFGMPRRMATGVDYNRIILLIAVLEKRAGLNLNSHDAYVNVVGGLRLSEPACDLGIIAALASSFKNSYVKNDIVLMGEVGLTGEVRAVNQIEKRVKEAFNLGFKKCLVPFGNLKILQKTKGLENMDITGVSNVRDVIEVLF